MSPDFLSPSPTPAKETETTSMGNGQRESGPFIEGGGDDNGTEGQKKSVEARDKRNIARKKKESGRKLQSHEIRRTARMVRRKGGRSGASLVAEKFFPTATDPHSQDLVGRSGQHLQQRLAVHVRRVRHCGLLHTELKSSNSFRSWIFIL